MTGLTLEEQERWAYANGDFERAALLAVAIDGVDGGTEELQWQVEHLEEEIRDLERQVEELSE